MGDQMLTEDKRCGKCGAAVTSWEGEPYREDTSRGWVEVTAVAYVLQPCGDVFIKAVDRG